MYYQTHLILSGSVRSFTMTAPLLLTRKLPNDLLIVKQGSKARQRLRKDWSWRWYHLEAC